MLAIVALAAGCAFPQERAILDRFFSASRLRDTTALAAYSTVIFEPLRDGIVTTFEIESVTPESADSSASDRSGTATKIVTLTAPVRLPDGTVAEKMIAVTMQRHDDRWVVTAFRMLKQVAEKTRHGEVRSENLEVRKADSGSFRHSF